MAPFPCSSEHAAASALLLLTVTPPPPPQPRKIGLDGGDESSAARSELGKSGSADFGEQSFVSGGDSKSCCTSLPAGSSEETQARSIKMIAVAALYRDVKLEAAQKKRSKIQRGVKFTSWKTRSGVKTTSFASTSSESSSCLSTSSSAAYSRARSRYYYNEEPAKLASVGEEEHSKKIMFQKKKVGSSANMRRKAEAILELLSQGGCFSEVKIRQTLGDSPDTSKALRLLLKFAEVKRTGAGGRRSPYIYMAGTIA